MQCNPSSYAWGPGYAPPARPASSGGSWCGVLLFILLLSMGLWWLCSGPKKTVPVLVEDIVITDDVIVQDPTGATGGRKHKYGAAHGGSCSDPGVPRAHVAAFPSGGGGATAPLDVGPPLVASVGGLNLPGSAAAGTTLAGAFDLTEPGQEYMAAYNPTGLASVMPAGWRAGAEADSAGCKAAAGDSYAEFSRYSITPEAVARSENMRSVLRLSENTRQGMGRTLGYQSLLRNYVTPVGPQPIGDKSMLFNDSSVRQSYIASVTGTFPDLGLC